jgi:hypothetical protein
MTSAEMAKLQELANDAKQRQPICEVSQRYIAALHPLGHQEAGTELSRRCAGLDGTPGLPPPYVVDLAAISPEAKQFAAALGLSLGILLAICNDEVGFGADGGVSFRLTAEEIEAESKIRDESGQFHLSGYLHPFFEASGLVSVDPFTGDRLVSTHSFVFDHLHIAYRFAGLEAFYVVIGGIGSVVRMIAFPRLNCLVMAHVPGEDERHKQWSIALYGSLLSSMLRQGAEMTSIFQAPRHKTGVAIGSWPNLGHFIWQELSGLEDVLLIHGPAAVRHLILGPHTYLPVGEVFPEIADKPMDTYTSAPNSFITTFRLPYQHIRPTNVFIRRSLRERIFRVSEAHVGAELQARISALHANRFVFWITLRSHNKSWLRQVDGHIQVARRLAQEIPNFVVLLDGWVDTRDAGNAIRAGLEPDVQVVDTIGCPLYETFLWARAAHIYSSVVSTGLHFTAHFAGCPGVAHGNSQHLRQVAFWNYLAPASCPPMLFAPTEVQDVTDGGLYDSYDFEPELLYQRLRSLTERYYPQRFAGRLRQG